jgi:pimeloyl-ACP methyl ester carboxylesterase
MKRFKPLAFLIAFMFASYALIIAMLYLFQDHIIFLPIKTQKENQYSFSFPFEEHFLKHPNGEKINGLYFKTDVKSKGLVVYFHGNYGNLQTWGKTSKSFTDRGFDAFMIDYRGYGKSDGLPSEVNLFEDGLLAFQWAHQKYSTDSIIIYGRSLGSAVACSVSSQVSSKSLILESPLASVEEIVAFKYPFLLFPSTPENNFNNLSRISKVDCPVHIIHGNQDEVIPLESMNVLRNYLKPNDSFYIIEGGNHNNLSSFSSFHNELDRLLK